MNLIYNTTLNINNIMKLSEDFSYLRIDLYSVNNRIYFGEYTFTSGNGFEKFYPEYYDLEFGKKFIVQKN